MKINQRLFDHYGIDTTKDLKLKTRIKCPRPFDTVLIDRQGSCYACECQAWLPQSIGNLQIVPLEQILEGDMRTHLQSSIDDGSYRYCNQERCSYLKRGFEWQDNRELQLRLAIDDSCNLRCPSCRKQLIFKKSGAEYDLGVRLADKINHWLSTRTSPVQVHIGSDGDPFASHVYRHFMEHTPSNPNINYSLLTNGLMFKEFHETIPQVMCNLTNLGVSMDGATKQTYEKLRLGGKWDKITDNLKTIADLKSTHKFQLAMHFVIQRENFHEMEMFIELAAKYKADRVYLNKIEDWQVMDNWPDQDIFNQHHPLHEQFKREFDKVKPMLRREDRTPMVEAPHLHTRSS